MFQSTETDLVSLEDTQLQADALREQAWKYFESRDNALSLNAFSQWVQLQPDSAEAWFGYGWTGLLVHGETTADDMNMQAVVAPIRKALKLNRRSNELTAEQLSAAHCMLGQILRLSGKAEEAIDHFQQSIEVAPRSRMSVEARNGLAGILDEKQEWDKAEQLLKDALAVEPGNEQIIGNLSIVQVHRDSLEVILHVYLTEHGLFVRKIVVQTRLDETLGNLVERTLKEHFNKSPSGGQYIYSGDDALPAPLDPCYREPHQTLREIGVRDRDTIMYIGMAATSQRSQLTSSDLVEKVTNYRKEGNEEQAKQEITWAIREAQRKYENKHLDMAAAALKMVLQVDPENPNAQALLQEVQRSIERREASITRTDGIHWLQSHGGPSRTGLSAKGPQPPLQRLWEFSTEGETFSTPVLANGRIFIVSNNLCCYCLDANTGECLWEWELPASPIDAPLVLGEYLYVADRLGITCLLSEIGKQAWRFEECPIRAVVCDSRTLLVADKQGEILFLPAETGQLIKQISSGVENIHALAIRDNRLIAVSSQQTVCVDIENSKIKWHCNGRFDESVPMLAYDRVYLGTFQEGLWCLDRETGRLLWIFGTDSWIRIAPSTTRGCIYFGDISGRFGCLDADTGELIWSPIEWINNRFSFSTPPVIAEPFLYILMGNGVLYCLDIVSGKELWREVAEVHCGGVGSLMVTQQATYYTTSDGKLGCFANEQQIEQQSKTPRSQKPSLRVDYPQSANAWEDAKFVFQEFTTDSELSPKERNEFNNAIYYLIHNRVEEALAIFRRLARDHPHEEVVLQNLARTYWRQELFEDALAIFERLLSINPNDLKAAEAYEELLAKIKSPEIPQVRDHVNRGQSLQKVEKNREAIRYYQEAVQIDPSCADAWFGLGRCYHQLAREENSRAGGNNYFSAGLDHLDRAISHFEQVVQLEPNSPDAHLNLALAYDNGCQLDVAEEHYREAIQLDPEGMDSADAYFNLSLLLYQRAIGHAGKRQNPMIISVSLNDPALDHAFQTAEQGVVVAQKICEKQKDFLPSLIQAHRRLGIWYDRHLQGSRAIGHYREVLRLVPDDQEAREWLLIAEQNTGQKLLVERGFILMRFLPDEMDLSLSFRKAAEQARIEGLKPFVYLENHDVSFCQSFRAWMEHPETADVFQGGYFLLLNDADQERLSQWLGGTSLEDSLMLSLDEQGEPIDSLDVQTMLKSDLTTILKMLRGFIHNQREHVHQQEDTAKHEETKIIDSRPDDLDGTFRFCCSCGWEFLSSVRSAGDTINCIQCHKEIRVPRCSNVGTET